jgi:hypothetical protein
MLHRIRSCRELRNSSSMRPFADALPAQEDAPLPSAAVVGENVCGGDTRSVGGSEGR